MDELIGLFGVEDREIETLPETLPPEVEEGNVEYKLKLVNPSDSRFEHLVTQMKWRLQEGEGEAIYEIGVTDGGMLAGLTEDEMRASLSTLEKMTSKLNATMSVLRERKIESEDGKTARRAAEILVRKVPDNQQFIDHRLAVLGNVDSGKSTLIGVLTHSELDNGHGRARLNLFRHLHEIQSGRTSSISHEILGFNNKGEVVNYNESRTAEEICENSSKLFTLIDLCGHTKYLKTTIFGLTGRSPDFAMLVVSASTGVVGTTKEHLGLALALGVPIFVVVTKMDLCGRAQVQRCIKQLERILKSPGCKKVPFNVENEDDAITAATQFPSDSVCPIFSVSNVSGKNLDLLIKFLNVLPPVYSAREREKLLQHHTEHTIDEIYNISAVGTVAGGTIHRGTIKEGDVLSIGPSDTGCFSPVTVLTIHRNRHPCRIATAGQTACVSFQIEPEFPVRRGMVLVSHALNPHACLEFEADIYLLFHHGSISANFQTVVHVGNVRQTATISKMNKNSVRTNEKAVVRFTFKNRPEYLRTGARLLFREGRTKGMGEVTKIYPIGESTSTSDCER